MKTLWENYGQREFLTKNLLTPATLRLKPGAMVMFTVNKNESGRREPLFVNGQVGTVEEVRNAGCGVKMGIMGIMGRMWFG